MHGRQIVGGVLRKDDLRALGKMKFTVALEMDRSGHPSPLRHDNTATAGLFGRFERGFERRRALRAVRLGAVIGDDEISGIDEHRQRQQCNRNKFYHIILSLIKRE